MRPIATGVQSVRGARTRAATCHGDEGFAGLAISLLAALVAFVSEIVILIAVMSMIKILRIAV